MKLFNIPLFLSSVMAVALPFQGFAQDDNHILSLDINARVDYQRDWLDGHTVIDNSGFEAQYLNLMLNGTITKGLSYSWRQRFNKNVIDGHFFNATDWLYLRYDYRQWSFSAGKEVVGIGGYEYDRAPIDIYSGSVFWNNIPCYDLGVTVGFAPTSHDRIKAQVTQSPFYTQQNRDMYAYNLMWEGNHGIFSSLWSANLIEYADGRYISYIALGNKFKYENVELELDLMNRASSHQTFFFKDCSVIGELAWRPAKNWRVFGKMTYDVNHSGTDADVTVMDGTELTMAGVGVEFFPLMKERTDLRLHADLFYSWGHNANSANVMQDKTMLFNVGIKWNMNLVKLKRK